MHYLLFYEVVGDYAERRLTFRAAHLEHARSAVERGELLLGGALADPVDGAVLLFRGDSQAVAEAFAASDPYVINGLVTRWRVRAWSTVVGVDVHPRKLVKGGPWAVARRLQAWWHADARPRSGGGLEWRRGSRTTR